MRSDKYTDANTFTTIGPTELNTISGGFDTNLLAPVGSPERCNALPKAIQHWSARQNSEFEAAKSSTNAFDMMSRASNSVGATSMVKYYANDLAKNCSWAR